MTRFWLSLTALAWALSSIGAGLNLIADNPGKYANDVMISTLVLLVALSGLFTWLALGLRRRRTNFGKPS